MCTVEVSRPVCIAEVLLRKAMRVRNHLNGRNNSGDRISYARRALFTDSPVDHEVTAQILARQTERIRQEMTAKWNFDFDTETPLQGRYLWTPVVETTNATETQTTSKPSTSSTTDVIVDDTLPELVPVGDTNISENTSTKRATRQKRVTEYMVHRKRSSTSKIETSSEKKVRRTSTSSSSSSTANTA